MLFGEFRGICLCLLHEDLSRIQIEFDKHGHVFVSFAVLKFEFELFSSILVMMIGQGQMLTFSTVLPQQSSVNSMRTSHQKK